MTREKDNSEITHAAIKLLGLKSEKYNSNSTGDVPFHCPFHTDKTPSMFLHINRGIYKCFSCNKSGTVAGLYYELTGNSLYKALNINNSSFSLFSMSNNYSSSSSVKDYSQVPNLAARIEGNKQSLRSSSDALLFLRARGISLKAMDSMNACFIDEGTIQMVETDDENEKIFYKALNVYNRILTPIVEQGRTLSVDARDATRKSKKKVLYPKGSFISTLFDIDKLDKDEPVYVVEGLLDLAVLRSDEYFKNSTCVLGASLSERQMYLMSQFKELILIPDNDQAGNNTIKKLKESLGKPFYVLRPPKSIKDIGDIPVKLKKTVKSLRERYWLESKVFSEYIK
jgi:DNA primase